MVRFCQKFRDWGHAMVNDLADPKNQASGKFIVRCVKMKDDTYYEFCALLREIDAEFTRRGIREMSTSVQELKPMRWISLTDSSSFVSGTEIRKN